MITIRRATREDVPSVLALVRDLATYEREPDAVHATEADLLRDGFGPTPAFHVLLASEDAADAIAPGAPIGFALYFFSYSTWNGRRCLYLEDLFVKPEHRGNGAGLLLMRALAGEALANGCRRFVWEVLDWNAPSIAFYEKIGANVMREWLNVRLEGEALNRLAAGAPVVKAAPQ